MGKSAHTILGDGAEHKNLIVPVGGMRDLRPASDLPEQIIRKMLARIDFLYGWYRDCNFTIAEKNI